MKKNLRIEIFVVLIALASVSFYVARHWGGKLSTRQPSEDNNVGPNIPSQNTATHINSHRERSIANIRAEKETDKYNKIETFNLRGEEGRTFVSFAYPEDISSGEQPGLVVLDITDRSHPSVFWEIKSRLFFDEPDRVYTQDITGDGQPELLSKWGVGAQLKGNMFWVFSYDGQTFTNITPVTDKPFGGFQYARFDIDIQKEIGYRSVFWGRAVNLIAIDQDNVSDVEVRYATGDNSEDTKIDTYRWDGTKYYLLKEKIEKPNE